MLCLVQRVNDREMGVLRGGHLRQTCAAESGQANKWRNQNAHTFGIERALETSETEA